MALINDFEVWASGSSAVYDKSQYLDSNHTGYVPLEKIYARVLNGILKDVSLVTVSLLAALLSTTSADTSGMTFNNDQTAADMQAQFETLLLNRNTDTATRWQTPRTVNIKNSSNTVLATATGVDGTANVNLQFPAVVDISISGNAATATNATNATNATYIKKTNSSPSSTTRHYLAAFTSPGTTSSSEVQVLENLTYLPNINTLATNISGNAATATNASKAQKVSIAAFGNCAATSSPQNYVTIRGNDYPNNVPAVYTVTMVWERIDHTFALADTFTIKHDGSSLYTTSVFALTDATGNGSIYIFRLKFSTITDSSNYTATLQYSDNGGNTFSNTGREKILRIDRQACY